ncbi:hypothetical protein N7462_001602 [Penicillium macrosclerotiorum]|uniref:uncharacterized protein n=1 Tax=Penicillium macrosclerotiorum TaxID=303699 RepID=UPI002548F5EB|nr:uncharacterized protein N7462_001602 [Penicillium macrosclerotiorum]KAJ5692179.1 hypothetical protein N7462_001602 [Penicillium macrosclerotiorum]
MITMFFQGTLQDGIALAVRETKAVVCFVRGQYLPASHDPSSSDRASCADDATLSSTWEEEYFLDDELAQALDAKAVLLRLTAGTQEVAFLSSFCPIAEFPATIVIQNGTLQEYLLPGISKEDFKARLVAAINGQGPSVSASTRQSQNSTASINNTVTPVAPNTAIPASPPTSSQPSPSTSVLSSSTPPIQSNHTSLEDRVVHKKTPKPASSKSQPSKENQKKPSPLPGAKEKTVHVPPKAPNPIASKDPAPTVEEPKPQSPIPRGPPSHYRLQVRLFDGRSVRSSFLPNQTISRNVRPWLDEQMTDDHRPYNLKHILTPLPNRTLSLSEESQTLQDLGLGSTANLVMVPVRSYTEAYASAAASLPARGISAVYNVVSSVASSATGIMGSFIGLSSNASATEPAPASSSPTPSENTRRPHSTGPRIRTLRDQQIGQDENQLYNGNQLNFEPRNQDSKDD